MTLEMTGPRPGLEEPEPPAAREQVAAPARGRRWLRNPWLALFSVIVFGWLAYYVWPSYFTFDPANARIVLRDNTTVHYSVLLVHLIGGSVAMLAACLQMWPRLRRTRPAVHRFVGRTYVFAGVIPGAAASIVLMLILGSWTGSVGSAIWAALWVVSAVAGMRAARQRRFADHRKWMIRGFALTMAIMWSRIIFDVIFRAGLETKVDFVVFGEFVGWGPWVIHLIIAQWWLDRTATRPSSLQPA